MSSKRPMMSDEDGNDERPVEDAEVAPIEPEPVEEVVLDPNQHFFVDGDVTPRVFPEGEVRSRRLWVDGKNVEHVHDHESGCWVYRHM